MWWYNDPYTQSPFSLKGQSEAYKVGEAYRVGGAYRVGEAYRLVRPTGLVRVTGLVTFKLTTANSVYTR